MILSIIVPVYKIEESYFRECLNSLVAIENNDVEIILVDDGSPDNCGVICDEYAEKDSRIRVLHKENAGVSAARNDGIRMAQGKYLMFVDADDWVDMRQIYSLVTTKKAEDIDILFWGEKIVWDDGREKDEYPLPTEQVFSLPEEIENLQLMTFGRKYGALRRNRAAECMASINDKAIKTDLVRKKDIFFDERVTLGEDGLFALKIFGASKKCCYFHAVPYHYRQRETSACHAYKSNADDEVLQVFTATKQYLDESNAPEEFYTALNHRCFDWMGYWISSSHIQSKNDLIKAKKRLKEEPFCSVIRAVKMKNFDWKGKVKIILFRLGLIWTYLWLK